MGHRCFVENESSPFTFTEYAVKENKVKALQSVCDINPLDKIDMVESDAPIVVVWDTDDSITLYRRPYRNVFYILGECFRDFNGKWVFKSFYGKEFTTVNTDSDVAIAIIRTPRSQRTLGDFIIADSYFFPCN